MTSFLGCCLATALSEFKLDFKVNFLGCISSCQLIFTIICPFVKLASIVIFKYISEDRQVYA